MEIIAYVVGFYFVCMIVSAIMPRDNKIGRTAGNIKGIADDALETFNESIEKTRADMRAEQERQKREKIENERKLLSHKDNYIDVEAIND